MNSSLYILIVLELLVSCANVDKKKNVSLPKETVMQKDTCDNPDANISCCFISIPANPDSIMTIAAPGEAGEKLIISGTIYKADGRTPYPNVILYAYHTDSKGYYSKTGN